MEEVSTAISKQVESSKAKANQDDSHSMKMQKIYEKESYQFLREMTAGWEIKYIRFNLVLLSNIWRSMFDSVVVNKDGLSQLAEIVAKAKGPVLMLPNHKSDVDFLLLSYINYSHGIKLPYIASSEHYIKIFGFSNMMRASGGFFFNRNRMGNPIYRGCL